MTLDYQPTVGDIEALIAARHSLLRNGYDIGRFVKEYFVFTETADSFGDRRRRMHLATNQPIDTEAVKQILPRFSDLDENLNNEAVNLDVMSTLGCTPSELGSITLYLSNMVNLAEL